MRIKDLQEYTHPMSKPLKKKRHPFGAWMLFLRLNAGLTQLQTVLSVSSQTGESLHQSRLASWEINGTTPPGNIVPALCNAYGITLATFFQVKYDTEIGKYQKMEAPANLDPYHMSENELLWRGSTVWNDPLGQYQVRMGKKEIEALHRKFKRYKPGQNPKQ